MYVCMYVIDVINLIIVINVMQLYCIVLYCNVM